MNKVIIVQKVRTAATLSFNNNKVILRVEKNNARNTGDTLH